MKKILLLILLSTSILCFAEDDSREGDRARLEKICPELVQEFDNCGMNYSCTNPIEWKCQKKISGVKSK